MVSSRLQGSQRHFASYFITDSYLLYCSPFHFFRLCLQGKCSRRWNPYVCSDNFFTIFRTVFSDGSVFCVVVVLMVFSLCALWTTVAAIGRNKHRNSKDYDKRKALTDSTETSVLFHLFNISNVIVVISTAMFIPMVLGKIPVFPDT